MKFSILGGCCSASSVDVISNSVQSPVAAPQSSHPSPIPSPINPKSRPSNIESEASGVISGAAGETQHTHASPDAETQGNQLALEPAYQGLRMQVKLLGMIKENKNKQDRPLDRKFGLAKSLDTNKPGWPHIIESPWTDGILLSYRQKRAEQAQNLENSSSPLEHYVLQEYATESKYEDYESLFSKNVPMDNAYSKQPSVVPNIMHWVWLGSDMNQADLQRMVQFATEHKNHDLNIWTDDPRIVQNALKKLAPLPLNQSLNLDFSRSLSDLFGNISDFKSRLKIQKIETLFSENQLGDNENKALEGIYLREKNGPLRNYAATSDIVRLMALKKFGGAYMDVDMVVNNYHSDPEKPQAPMENITAPKGFLANWDCNSALACTTETPLITEMLEQIIHTYNEGIDDAPVYWSNKRMQEVNKETHKWSTRLYETVESTGPGLVHSVLVQAGKSEEVIFQNQLFAGDASGRSYS